MSSVNDEIVRQYLELMGFLVVQPRKHLPAGRMRRPEDEMDLLAFNPRPTPVRKPTGLLWTGADIRGVSRMLVSVRGWHTDRFGPSVLRKAPEIFQFAGPKAVERLAPRLGGGPVARILCLSGLPASSSLRNDTLDLLKEKGIDGVLLFHTILEDLLQHVNVKRNYEKSDLLRDDQLELFSRKRKKRKRSQDTA